MTGNATSFVQGNKTVNHTANKTANVSHNISGNLSANTTANVSGNSSILDNKTKMAQVDEEVRKS